MDELHVLEDSDRDTCMAREADRRSGLTGWTSTRATRAGPTDRSRLVCQESRWRSTVGLKLADDRVGGPRRQRGFDAVGHFPSKSSLTACTSCLCDHQWQGLQVAQSNVWTARCRSIIRQKGVRCDELDGSVLGQVQHLCWIQEGGVVTIASVSGRRSLCRPFRDDLGKHLAGQDDSSVVSQRGDGRCAGSNPPKQTVEALPSRGRGNGDGSSRPTLSPLRF